MANTDFRHDKQILDTALPYVTNRTPTDETPAFASGSTNVMTSFKKYAERRPGFPLHTADNFVSLLGAGAQIVRWFDWQRWDGSFYIIICVLQGSNSYVYKQKIGTDATFVQILTSASTEPFDFVVSHNFLFMMNGTTKKKYDGTTVTDWGYPGPTSAPTTANAAAGNVPAASALGHTYVAAYGTSATGYITDISPESDPITTANRQWDVTVPRCTNTNCDEVHFYRTEDGGGVWRELSNSPMANPGAGSATIRDNDSDEDLKDTQAPLVGVNAEPVIGFDPTFFAGRIWWFKDDTLYSTGFEEVTNGFRPESAPTDNRRQFGKPIKALGKAGPYLLILSVDVVWRISGDNLATFTLEGSIDGYGTENRGSVVYDKEICYWFDTLGTVIASNGLAPADIGIPIHPDFENVNHSTVTLAVFKSGVRNWLCLAHTVAGSLYVYDLNMTRWMPPWPHASLESVGMGRTAAGTRKLFISRSGLPCVMGPTAYLDFGSASYTANAVTWPQTIAANNNPMINGQLYYVGLETNANEPSAVTVLFDTIPGSGSPVDLTANKKDPHNRATGGGIVDKWYWTKAERPARRVSVNIAWPSANSQFILYSIDPAYRLGPGGVS